MYRLLAITITLSALSVSLAQTNSRMTPQPNVPNGYWPVEKSQPIIDKTQTITLSPDLSRLSAGERTAVAKLIEVGQIFQKLYEEQRHPEATSSYRALQQLDKRTGSSPRTTNLLTLYRLFQGPIATTLDNKREPFLPVDRQPLEKLYIRGTSPKRSLSSGL